MLFLYNQTDSMTANVFYKLIQHIRRDDRLAGVLYYLLKQGGKNMKIFRKTAAALTALMLTVGYAGSLTCAALNAEAYSKADIVAAVHASDLKADEYERDTSFRYGGLWPILSITDNNAPVMDKVDLPAKFDLRNVDGKNYVSPVKDQTPWGTCWSFGGTAAAEISVAAAKGLDYNDTENDWLWPLYDFSEKHLAWFTFTPLTEKSGKYFSQAGEGSYVGYPDGSTAEEISNMVYNRGGIYTTSTTMYSAGIGPAFEKDFPYRTSDETAGLIQLIFIIEQITGDYETDRSAVKAPYNEIVNKEDAEAIIDELIKEYSDYELVTINDLENIIEKPSVENIGKKYSTIYAKDVTDWLLDESGRFSSAYYLKDGNILPPVYILGENKEYIYNPAGIEAIKRELVNGRGVAVAFHADQSLPGQIIGDGGYMNFIDKNGNRTNDQNNAVIWAQYTYDKSYDPADTDSVNKPVPSNHAVCIVGYDDTFPKEYFNDPNGTIGGDGAWIVKNSWGTEWGSEGTGYFYLSYYDQSTVMAESYNFDTDSDTSYLMKNIDMYDFLPNVGRSRVSMENEIGMASVFTAENNCAVRFIGVDVTSADSAVEYSVYKLKDNASSPVDGDLFAQSTEHFDYIGYHMVDIGRSMNLRGGEKYSVVVKIKDPDGYQLNVSRDINKQGMDYYEPYAHERFLDSGEDPSKYTPSTIYTKAVVNKGESFVGSGSEWTDWTDVIAELKVLNKDLNNDGFEYDNFAVRSYPETEFLSVSNTPAAVQESYKAGDVLKGVIELTQNSASSGSISDLGINIELELTINGKQLMLGENNKDGIISDLREKGQSVKVPYEYTVTEEDVAKGCIESSVRLKLADVYLDVERPPIFPEDMVFEVVAAVGEQPQESVPGSDSGSNPKTGESAVGIAVIAMAAAASVAVIRKKH